MRPPSRPCARASCAARWRAMGRRMLSAACTTSTGSSGPSRRTPSRSCGSGRCTSTRPRRSRPSGGRSRPSPRSSLGAMSTPTAEHAVVEAVPTQLYIRGDWRDAAEGGTLAVEDPATGETLTEVADATVDDAKAALGAAHEAFAEWRDSAPRDRADILHRAFGLIMERQDDLALLMTLEMGKPLAESQ